MSKDVFNKIINIVCIIIGVIALAFAITACCLINDDSEKVTVESITADDAGNIVVTYTDDTVVIIPLVAGEDGKSAYELYVESVPEDEEPMTEAEWLASLKGTNGADGEDGEDGVNGKSAYEIYVATVPEGETPMTETEWLESLKGQDGNGIKDILFIGGELVFILDDGTMYHFDINEENDTVMPEL